MPVGIVSLRLSDVREVHVVLAHTESLGEDGGGAGDGEEDPGRGSGQGQRQALLLGDGNKVGGDLPTSGRVGSVDNHLE